MDFLTQLIDKVKPFLESIAAIITILGAIIGVFIFFRQRNTKSAVQASFDFKPTWPEGAMRNYDSTKPLAWHIENKEIMYSYLTINVTLLNQLKVKEIQLAPYLLIHTTKIDPMPFCEYYLVADGKGGVAEIRTSLAILTPDQAKISPAPLVKEIKGHPLSETGPGSQFIYYDVEFLKNIILTLKPRENEVINIDVRYVSGFYYTFQIGVLYKVGNKSHIKWIDEKFTIGIPSVAENVLITDGITFYADTKTTDTVNLDAGVIPDNAREIIKKAQKIVQNSPFDIPTK